MPRHTRDVSVRGSRDQAPSSNRRRKPEPWYSLSRKPMNIIHVENLIKKFGTITAVDNIQLNVESGQMFGFLGPNGAGKSTTIKILATLLRPTAGKAVVAGFDVLTNPNEVRRSIGLVFQDQSLDDRLTAQENLWFHAMLYDLPSSVFVERANDVLRLVDLLDRRHSLVRTFSGGMKRRLEIARGLLHHPKVLFLDEPTLGLDPQTRNAIWKHVRNLTATEGVTVFLTTHYMDEADRVADRIAVIDHGRLVATGSSAELKDQTGADSLEAAFLALTGTTIRDESATAADQMRQVARVWRR